MPGNTVASANIEVARREAGSIIMDATWLRFFAALRALKRTAKFKQPLTRQQIETKPGFMHSLHLK
jgi:hypothetical protein